MEKITLPKKILMIKDCTFILPEDFSGSLEEAFTEFLKYREAHLDGATRIDDSNIFSTFDILMHSAKDAKACGQYAIYELVNGSYRILNNDQHT